jgi:hypothetical protein
MSVPAADAPFREDGLLSKPASEPRCDDHAHDRRPGDRSRNSAAGGETSCGSADVVGGWLLQIAGHRLLEHNLPSTHKGWITYQFTGVIHVCEQCGELLTRRSRRKAAAKVLT